jgi:hypothetical protein
MSNDEIPMPHQCSPRKTWPRPKSLAAGPLLILKQALKTGSDQFSWLICPGRGWITCICESPNFNARARRGRAATKAGQVERRKCQRNDGQGNELQTLLPIPLTNIPLTIFAERRDSKVLQAKGVSDAKSMSPKLVRANFVSCPLPWGFSFGSARRSRSTGNGVPRL